MGHYRKKPVVIEAVQFDGNEWVDDVLEPMFEGHFDRVPRWIVEARAKAEINAGAMWVWGQQLCIKTLEGNHLADPGDWIIRGIQGELYPCKPDIFAATYEAA